MNGINVRRAELKDIEAVSLIEMESINSWSYNQFLGELKNSFSVFLIAETGQTVAGYIVCWFIAGEVQINSIAVHRNFRRSGIASLLLESALEDDRCADTEIIFLEVRSRNSGAVSFYKNLGFVQKGLRKNYYDNDDAVLMEKRIK